MLLQVHCRWSVPANPGRQVCAPGDAAAGKVCLVGGSSHLSPANSPRQCATARCCRWCLTGQNIPGIQCYSLVLCQLGCMTFMPNCISSCMWHNLVACAECNPCPELVYSLQCSALQGLCYMTARQHAALQGTANCVVVTCIQLPVQGLCLEQPLAYGMVVSCFVRYNIARSGIASLHSSGMPLQLSKLMACGVQFKCCLHRTC